MRNLLRFIVLPLVLAACAFVGFQVHSHRTEQARYEEMLARQQAAVQVLEQMHVQTPWLLPVPDAPDSTPATTTFTFMGEEHSIQATANHRIYYGARIAGRDALWDHLWSDIWQRNSNLGMDKLDRKLDEKYYNFLAFDPQMDHAIESVLTQLRTIRDERDLNNDEYIELIVKYVQAIPYCEVHGTLDLEERPIGCPRTPIQVLVDGTGDCDETGMLLAVLLHREGYPVSLLHFRPEQHVAVGLRIEGDGFKGTGYAYIEPTSFSYISDVPETLGFDNEIVLESMPIVLSMGGEVENPMPYYSAEALAEVARIIDVRDRAQSAADWRFAHIERTPMSRAEFNRQRALYEACFVPLNRFFDVDPDPNDNINTDFMDRTEAIAWINQNAWWE